MSNNYLLIVFDKGLGYPEELEVLEEVINDDTKAAGCGPMNICIFSSNLSKEEIAKKLKENSIHFILNELDKSDYVFPDQINEHFFPKEKKKVKMKKMSLEDQLQNAVKNEDYVAAAKIRDKIKSNQEWKKI